MVKGPEQLAELGRGGVETAMKFANLAMESAEKMMRLQLEAARTIVAEQTENAKALGEAKDPEGMMALRNRLTEQAVERAMGYSRNVYDIAAATQAEMARMMQERFAAYQKEMTDTVAQMFQNAPGGSQGALTALQSTFAATQAAIENITKAAKQAQELADTNVRAAMSAAQAAAPKKKA